MVDLRSVACVPLTPWVVINISYLDVSKGYSIDAKLKKVSKQDVYFLKRLFTEMWVYTEMWDNIFKCTGYFMLLHLLFNNI